MSCMVSPSLRLLLFSCWALAFLQLMMYSGGGPEAEPPFTIFTIQGGFESLGTANAPQSSPAPRAGDSWQYQDENESATGKGSRPRLDLQPWANDSWALGAEVSRLLQHIRTNQFNCSNAVSPLERKGGTDGAWKVCLQRSPPRHPSRRCVVYTFSVVKRDSGFGQRMEGLGCEVHSFGVISPEHAGQFLHPRIWLDWGPRAPNTTQSRRKSSAKTLRQILQELGHLKVLQEKAGPRAVGCSFTAAIGGSLELTGRGDLVLDALLEWPRQEWDSRIYTVDVLEADLASTEWKILESLLLDGTVEAIGQLILTLHLHWAGFEVSGSDPDVVRYWYSLLRALEGRGFRLNHSYRNPGRPPHILHRTVINASSTYTLSWVNTKWRD